MTDPVVARAQLLLDAGRPQAALQLVTKQGQLLGTDPAALAVAAAAAFAMEDFRRCVELCRSALVIDPARAGTTRLASMALSRLGDHDAAATTADEALRLRPDDWHNLVQRALVDVRGKRVTSATQDFVDEALRIAPNEPLVHATAGTVAMELGEDSPAQASFAESLRLDPQSIMARTNRGVAALRASHLATALGEFSAVARLDPTGPMAHRFDAVLFVASRRAMTSLLVATGVALLVLDSSSWTVRTIPAVICVIGWAAFIVPWRGAIRLLPPTVRRVADASRAFAVRCALATTTTLVLLMFPWVPAELRQLAVIIVLCCGVLSSVALVFQRSGR